MKVNSMIMYYWCIYIHVERRNLGS